MVGGFFDNQTSEQDRRAFLLSLLHEAAEDTRPHPMLEQGSKMGGGMRKASVSTRPTLTLWLPAACRSFRVGVDQDFRGKTLQPIFATESTQ
jgi:hypothetical protein